MPSPRTSKETGKQTKSMTILHCLKTERTKRFLMILKRYKSTRTEHSEQKTQGGSRRGTEQLESARQGNEREVGRVHNRGP